MKYTLTILALLLAVEAQAAAGCAKDTDCKGNRICEQSICVAPPQYSEAAPPQRAPATYRAPAHRAPRPVIAAPIPRNTYRAPAGTPRTPTATGIRGSLRTSQAPKLYFTLASTLSATGTGGIIDGDQHDAYDEDAMGGVYFGVHRRLGRVFQLGGYLSISDSQMKSEDIYDYDGNYFRLIMLNEVDVSLGSSLKLGGSVSANGAWLGFAFDSGIVINGEAKGAQIFLGMEFSAPLTSGGFKFGLAARFGLQAQYFGTVVEGSDAKFWRLRAAGLLGFTFGS